MVIIVRAEKIAGWFASDQREWHKSYRGDQWYDEDKEMFYFKDTPQYARWINWESKSALYCDLETKRTYTKPPVFEPLLLRCLGVAVLIVGIVAIFVQLTVGVHQ